MCRSNNSRGFTLLEILAATAIVGIILLAIATMVLTGYRTVDTGGKTTVAVAAGRQILEDVRSLPFDSLANLDGFDTVNSGTLPADEPERGVARRWRYSVAGPGDGFAFTSTEQSDWTTLSDDGFAIRAQIDVVTQTPTLRLITITLSPPGRDQLRLATMINRP